MSDNETVTESDEGEYISSENNPHSITTRVTRNAVEATGILRPSKHPRIIPSNSSGTFGKVKRLTGTSKSLSGFIRNQGKSLGFRRLSSTGLVATALSLKHVSSRLTLHPINPNAMALIRQPFKVPTFKKGIKNLVGALRAGTTLGMRPRTSTINGPLHDPENEDAVVLYTPKVLYNPADAWNPLKKKVPGELAPEVHVVVDPVLGLVLRPHQVTGVKFLYNCTTGQTVNGAFGCIMADEMGLGKTLQCIALLWTLLRQSPEPGKPTIEKAIIACPSSLVKNWANEIKKWLGESRVRPYSCDGKGTKESTTKDIENFVSAKGRGIVYPVLIVSYESLRMYSPILVKTEIGLLLCDEGHRLKNADSLTYIALNGLNAKRRVILSGTPIQNDLTEYFALLSFAIPDVLGTGAEFRKRFELPILRGRDAHATDKERLNSEEKLADLLTIANRFIIRRTAELLTKYLPVKYEHVVFCKMSEFQETIYKNLSKVEMSKLNAAERSETTKKGGVGSLKAITMLKKLVNHPVLVSRDDIKPEWIPKDFDFKAIQPEYSGKMWLLEQMLFQISTETTDKIVVISNYTQTLDFIERMCRDHKWKNCRLDGTMTIQKRQKLVDRFNDPEQPEFIFLLSSKAGGCGINLVGANRLILFDPDWNPATDLQALARVWRDGQKKTCFIYRFIATGTIEEKIFQRQAHKQSLSSCVVDEEQDVERHFSLESLRQLFQYNETTLCDTHDTFQCKRCKDGKQIVRPVQGTINTGATAADTSTWNHFSQLELNKAVDPILKETAAATLVVSFVFQNKSHDAQTSKT